MLAPLYLALVLSAGQTAAQSTAADRATAIAAAIGVILSEPKGDERNVRIEKLIMIGYDEANEPKLAGIIARLVAEK